jgi:hypothetical protein
VSGFDPVGHPLLAYALVPAGPAPPGIPAEGPTDPHAETPFATPFGARRTAFLAHVRASPPPPHLSAVFTEVARLAAGGPAHVPLFEAAADWVDARHDCADFVAHGLLRLVLHFGDDPRVPKALLARAHRALLGFQYGPDEPGGRELCTWTENHEILFASSALLAGQLHPDATFSNSGRSGAALAAAARARIDRWLDLRFRTGFSEWLSHVYYDEDLVALLALVDFAADPALATRAAMVADTLFLDLALHGFRGVFASSHGRSYDAAKRAAREENTTDTAKLAFGVGSFAGIENLSAACLALSRYRVPAAIEAIAARAAEGAPEAAGPARGRDGEAAAGSAVTIRQRMGLRLDQLASWGLDPRDPEDMRALLTLEAYAHPRTIAGFVALLDRYDWWDNAFFVPFARHRCLLRALARTRLLPVLARAFAWDLARNVRDEVDVLTFRTPDYQLSSAPDWNPGRGGDQQHVWQATLAPDAVCFTTHPGPRDARSPGWWTGSATLPRVGQVANVLVAIYAIPRRPALHVPNRNPFTHAWLPRERFDEWIERRGWVFARRSRGYLALRSQHPMRLLDGAELRADGRENVWLCELGREADDGPFACWIERIATAPLAFGRRSVVYESQSQGRIEFAWTGPLRRRGAIPRQRGFGRYESPWVTAGFPSQRLEVCCGGSALRLDWEKGERSTGPG